MKPCGTPFLIATISDIIPSDIASFTVTSSPPIHLDHYSKTATSQVDPKELLDSLPIYS